MKLFNESKNKYLLSAITLLNRIYNGENISESAFGREFLLEADDNGLGLGDEMLRKFKNKYNIFCFLDKRKTSLSIPAPALLTPSIMEKIWLKSALCDERMKLFLSEATISKLQEKLTDVEMLSNLEIIDIKGLFEGDVIDESFIRKFQMLLTAIKEQRYLHYSNTARDGEIYRDMTSMPFKIEYSIIQQKFRASMWSEKDRRPIKANISSMTDITVGNLITEKQFAVIKDMLASKLSPEPLVIKIFNRNNAVERASLLFSQYNRKSCWINENTLSMEIIYYTFDEDELISNVLSFGSMIKVISPSGIVHKILQRLAL